jgi:CRP-like cAMP-binding protein
MSGQRRPETSASEALESAINAHPFLVGLKADQLAALKDNAMLMRYQPGDIIFREGDPANRFYLIQNGKVALESRRQGSVPALIQHVGPGDLLGWSWLFPSYCWNFDARAVEPTEAIFFYGTWLRERCENDHDLGYELLKRMTSVIIQRLQATRKHLLAAKTRS